MNSRRSFFSKLAAIASVVVLAPEIAFRAKLEIPKAEPEKVPVTFRTQTQRHSMCLDNEYEKFVRQFVKQQFWPDAT